MKYIGIDMGGGSTRLFLGNTDPTPSLTEVSRFKSPFYTKNGQTFWDLELILQTLEKELTKIVESEDIDSISIDTWGVDYVRISQEGKFFQPFHYRDSAHSIHIPSLKSYKRFLQTGTQPLNINTAYQIISQSQKDPHFLSNTSRIVMIGEFLHEYFSGIPVMDKTIRSTSQMLDLPKTLHEKKLSYVETKDPSLISYFEKEKTQVLSNAPFRELFTQNPVIHDRAAALYGFTENDTFIISGTWSLVGRQVTKPFLTKEAFEKRVSNELSSDWNIHLLKNIPGMWFFQELLQDQSILSKITYTPHETYIDPYNPLFTAHGDMFGKIISYANQTSQKAPEHIQDAINIVLQSLAQSYSTVLSDLELISDKPITDLTLLGGGARCHALNQLIANKTGRTVRTGPIESSVIGNIAHQIAEKEGHEKAKQFYATFSENKVFYPK